MNKVDTLIKLHNKCQAALILMECQDNPLMVLDFKEQYQGFLKEINDLAIFEPRLPNASEMSDEAFKHLTGQRPDEFMSYCDNKNISQQ